MSSLSQMARFHQIIEGTRFRLGKKRRNGIGNKAFLPTRAEWRLPEPEVRAVEAGRVCSGIPYFSNSNSNFPASPPSSLEQGSPELGQRVWSRAENFPICKNALPLYIIFEEKYFRKKLTCIIFEKKRFDCFLFIRE